MFVFLVSYKSRPVPVKEDMKKKSVTRFGDLYYETLEEKIKRFLPLSSTQKYKMLMEFVEFMKEVERSRKDSHAPVK